MYIYTPIPNLLKGESYKANISVFHAPRADRYIPAFTMVSHISVPSKCLLFSSSEKKLAIPMILPTFYANIVYLYNKICTIRMNNLNTGSMFNESRKFLFDTFAKTFINGVWNFILVLQNALMPLNVVLETIQFWSMVTFVPNNTSCHVQALNFR